MKGIYFNDWKPPANPPPPPPGAVAKTSPPFRGLYAAPETDQSLKNLAATGANWIALSFGVFQENISSTKINYESPSATDAELKRVFDLAHSLGLRVLLMPQLFLSDDPSHWQGHIGTVFTSEKQWQEWFASYREFINYYAAFAQATGVDMLFIGNELGGVTHREADWRRIIQEVRQRFKGLITYDSLMTATWGFPHGEEQRIKWWDAVDYIGVGGYYELTNKNDPTVAELKDAWIKKGYVAQLENLSKKFNRPVIISEIGYLSTDGTNKVPADFKALRQAPIDLQEQADCYQAVFETLWGKPWLKGIFWWQWFANRPFGHGGPYDPTETPYGKPAEEVLKKYYLPQ
ncbi:MAG: hypothetical protein A2Z29_07885 [Chloroflexi bacterium RBG_16_56_11]|nr:MAG: hypothetical protein A2Z29_07885 [Chloroflexi bacterium RBG_16_56_11]